MGGGHKTYFNNDNCKNQDIITRKRGKNIELYFNLYQKLILKKYIKRINATRAKTLIILSFDKMFN